MFSILLGEFGCLFTYYSICSMFSPSTTWFAAYFVHYVERWFAAFLLTLWRHTYRRWSHRQQVLCHTTYALDCVHKVLPPCSQLFVNGLQIVKQCIIILIKIAEQNRSVKRCGLLTVRSIWLSGFETQRFFHLLQVHFQNSFEHFWVLYVYSSVVFLKGGQFISNNLEQGNDKLIK